MATKVMKGMLEKSKNLTYANTSVKIMSALNDESRAQLEALAAELCADSACEVETEEPKTVTKKFVCKICGYEYEGDTLPEDYICPLCRRPASDFEEVV